MYFWTKSNCYILTTECACVYQMREDFVCNGGLLWLCHSLHCFLMPNIFTISNCCILVHSSACQHHLFSLPLSLFFFFFSLSLSLSPLSIPFLSPSLSLFPFSLKVTSFFHPLVHGAVKISKPLYLPRSKTTKAIIHISIMSL